MAKNSSKVQKNTKKENIFKRLAENRYAKFQYEISETIEAGIELLGTAVKSIRNGKANLRDGYCSFRNGEILLLNVHISPHKNVGSFFNHDPLRNRKLLLHKKEMNQWLWLKGKKKVKWIWIKAKNNPMYSIPLALLIVYLIWK